MYRFFWCFWLRDRKRHQHSQPMLFQCRAGVKDCGSTLKQHRENATCLRKSYSRPSDGLVLGQRRTRLTGVAVSAYSPFGIPGGTLKLFSDYRGVTCEIYTILHTGGEINIFSSTPPPPRKLKLEKKQFQVTPLVSDYPGGTLKLVSVYRAIRSN